MKRKVASFFIIFFLIIIAAVIIVFLIYSSDWAKEKAPDPNGYGTILYELKKDEHTNTKVASYSCGDSFSDVEIRIFELEGTLRLDVYFVEADFAPEMDVHDLFKDKYKIRTYEFNDTGKYDFEFQLGKEKESFIGFYYTLVDGSSKASFRTTIYGYNNNWNELLRKLGLNLDDSVKVNEMVTE